MHSIQNHFTEMHWIQNPSVLRVTISLDDGKSCGFRKDGVVPRLLPLCLFNLKQQGDTTLKKVVNRNEKRQARGCSVLI